MGSKTHKLYPVSYVDDEGNQVDTLYTFKPGSEDIWVGEPIIIDTNHPDVAEPMRAAKILKMRETLAKLESGE